MLTRKWINKNNNEHFLKRGVIYLAANTYEKSLLFLLPAIFSFYIRPEDLSKLVICNTIILIVNIFLGQNINALITIDYVKLSKDDFSKLFNNIFYFILISSLIILVFAITLRELIYSHYGIHFENILLVILICILSISNQCFNSYLRVSNQSRFFLKTSITRTSLELIIASFGVYFLPRWEWRLYAAVFANLFLAFYYFFKLSNELNLQKKINYTLLSNITKFTIPLVPHALGGWMIQMIDKTLIPLIIDKYSLGIYSIAFQSGMVTSIVGISYNQSWAPHLYSMLSASNPRNELIVRSIYRYYIFLFVIAFINTIAASFFINHILPIQYRHQEIIIALTALGYCIQACCSGMLNFIFYHKMNNLLMLLTPIIGIIHLSICYILLNKIGILGASLSFVISNIIFFITAWFFANKVHPMPWFAFIKKIGQN